MSDNVFTIKSKKQSIIDKGRLIGSYMDSEIYSYLTLYTIAKQINKSNLLRRLLREWYKEIRKEEPIDQLIKELIHIAQREWNAKILNEGFHWSDKEKKSKFNDYKMELRRELKGKGVLNEYINRIVENLEE